MTIQAHPIDSGWSWMILVAASIMMFIWEGLVKSLSVLLPTLKEQFETHTWMIGLMITLMISVRDVAGLVVGILASKENNRVFACVGGTILGLSTICASVANNVMMLGIISFINGISFALIFIPMYALLGQCFDKFYPLATGVFSCSGTLGLMVFAPLTQLLLSTYGWRNTLLILGAIAFHLVISAVLMRSPTRASTGQYASLESPDLELAYSTTLIEIDNESNGTFSWMSETSRHSKSKIYQLLDLSGMSLFKNRSYSSVCVMMASINATWPGWLVYFIPHCIAKGITPFEASFLATAAGFSNLIGHVMYIPFVSRNILSVRGCIYLSGTVAAIALLLDKFTVTIATTSLANVLFAFGIGMAYPLCDVLMKSVIDPNLLAKAFAWRMAISGFVRIFSGFLVGWTYDYTGTYDAGFILLGAVQALGVIVLVVDHLY
ncbi:monocarboxylate transporter 13-like [Amphiura filiformis]|uniref:monocarboxylate transporter 13-like n=1 Tax=Amphiura filiformis TaxID=82378 RepID=UPI003B2153B8